MPWVFFSSLQLHPWFYENILLSYSVRDDDLLKKQKCISKTFDKVICISFCLIFCWLGSWLRLNTFKWIIQQIEHYNSAKIYHDSCFNEIHIFFSLTFSIYSRARNAFPKKRWWKRYRMLLFLCQIWAFKFVCLLRIKYTFYCLDDGDEFCQISSQIPEWLLRQVGSGLTQKKKKNIAYYAAYFMFLTQKSFIESKSHKQLDMPPLFCECFD